MNIDDIANENVKFCKESGKPIVDGKCVCSGKQSEKKCNCTNGCQEVIDIKKYLSLF